MCIILPFDDDIATTFCFCKRSISTETDNDISRLRINNIFNLVITRCLLVAFFVIYTFKLRSKETVLRLNADLFQLIANNQGQVDQKRLGLLLHDCIQVFFFPF